MGRVDKIVMAAAGMFRTSEEAIYAKHVRSRCVTEARHLCMLVLSEQGEEVWYIAAIFHMTERAVRSGLRKARSMTELYPYMARRFKLLMQEYGDNCC